MDGFGVGLNGQQLMRQIHLQMQDFERISKSMSKQFKIKTMINNKINNSKTKNQHKKFKINN